MKRYNKFLMIVILLFSACFLTSCEMGMLPVAPVTPTRTINEVYVDSTTVPKEAIVGTYDITESDLAISYNDGIVEYIDIDLSMISNEDLAKLNTVGIHSIVVNYNGYTTVFSINIIEKTTVNVDQIINSAISEVSLPGKVTANFALPTSKNGVNISWSSNSSNIAVQNSTAVVTRPLSTGTDVTVTLTATFNYEGTTKTKTYTVVVEKEEPIIDDNNGESSSGYEGTYYDAISFSLVGDALKQQLRSLMLSTHTKYTSYGDCKTYLPYIDEDLTNSNNMILFYTGQSIKKSQDLNNDWNREHVWAKSLAWFDTSGGGSDLHHIRPCNISVNSSRGNKKFGVGGSFYTPTDDYKGDVARIIFYLMIAYNEADRYSFTSIAQSKEILLEWNKLDPVSDIEIVRNNKVAEIQGNRNPFIDYSYLADSIWG